jgi:hypothetical protein
MTEAQIFIYLMVASSMVLIVSVMLYFTYLSYQELKHKARKLNVQFFESKMVIKRYDELLDLHLQKDIKQDELIDGLLNPNQGISGDHMAIIQNLDFKIQNLYREIIKDKQQKINSL